MEILRQLVVMVDTTGRGAYAFRRNGDLKTHIPIYWFWRGVSGESAPNPRWRQVCIEGSTRGGRGVVDFYCELRTAVARSTEAGLFRALHSQG